MVLPVADQVIFADQYGELAVLAGSHVLRWDGVSDSGRILSAGLYFYRLQTPWGVQTRKLLLLK